MKQLIPILALFLPAIVMAADETKESSWKGEGELGYTSTSGNTESETLNAKLGIEKSHDKWTHKAGLDVLRSTTDGVESANSLVATEKSSYQFSKKSYAYGAVRYEDDEFSGYEYQASLTVGLGRKLIKNDVQELDVSMGAGIKQLKAEGGEAKDEGMVQAALNYSRTLSEHARFNQDLLVESSEDNTYSESKSSLQMKINGNLSSKISYTVKHNSDVPVDVEETDTITSVTLVYGF